MKMRVRAATGAVLPSRPGNASLPISTSRTRRSKRHVSPERERDDERRGGARRQGAVDPPTEGADEGPAFQAEREVRYGKHVEAEGAPQKRRYARRRHGLGQAPAVAAGRGYELRDEDARFDPSPGVEGACSHRVVARLPREAPDGQAGLGVVAERRNPPDGELT